MKRQLEGKEKLYFAIATVLYLLITFLTAAYLAGYILSGENQLSILTTVSGVIGFTIGLVFSAAILKWLVQFLGPNQDITFGFTLYIYVLANLGVIIISNVMMLLIGISRYLAYTDIFGYVESFLYASLISYLFYRFEIIGKNKAIKLASIIILVQVAFGIVSLFI